MLSQIFFFNELWHLVTFMGNQDSFDLLAGSNGPAQYQKCFLSGCWPSSFWAPKRGKSLVIPLSCPIPRVRLALSKSVNNVRLYSVHALPPARGSHRGLECKCTWACQTVYKNRHGFWRQPLSHPSKEWHRDKSPTIIHWTWIFQSFPRDNNAFSWLLFFYFPFFFPLSALQYFIIATGGTVGLILLWRHGCWNY